MENENLRSLETGDFKFVDLENVQILYRLKFEKVAISVEGLFFFLIVKDFVFF